MTSKTITLTGAETRAVYSGGSNAWLRNDGTDVIYAAAVPGITAGADGVVSIPAGQAAAIYGVCGSVYLLGTGSVQLVGSDYTACPFKTSAQSGGSGADEVARAAINQHAGNVDIHVTAAEKSAWDAKADSADLDSHTSDTDIHITAGERTKWNAKADKSDIPTTLPANGGNADTVNGHTVNADVPANAKFTDTDTKYSAGTGISISGTTISNSGVRSVASGSANGTISVNTGGTAANIAVKGLASAAYQAVQTAAGTVGLHRISSGTAAATTTNCPAGCWYGQYE
ncbi:MAG: hypothetical protein EGR45_01525 [Ruminococcaceae bacterium]|nr:hypothetical protein [Oscillospiraceae bacterium]